MWVVHFGIFSQGFVPKDVAVFVEMDDPFGAASMLVVVVGKRKSIIVTLLILDHALGFEFVKRRLYESFPLELAVFIQFYNVYTTSKEYRSTVGGDHDRGAVTFVAFKLGMVAV